MNMILVILNLLKMLKVKETTTGVDSEEYALEIKYHCLKKPKKR